MKSLENRTKTRKEKAKIISAACLFFGVLIFGIASSFVYHFDTKAELNKKEVLKRQLKLITVLF